MNETNDRVDLTAGDYRILYADPKKWQMCLFVAGSFVLIGISMILMNGDFLSWFVTLFFLLVAGVALLQLFGTGSYLELDADTFTVTNIGRRTTERWEDCANFTAYRISRVEQVAYDRVRDVDTHLGEMNRSISGRSSGLPDTFGMTASDLAELMNAYQALALKRSWQRHADDVASYREKMAESLSTSGQAADLVTDPENMTLSPDMEPWPSILAILKEPRLDGLPHVLICADVLSPRSRWMTEEQKQKDAFELLGAEELQIIDPRTNQMRRFLRTTI